MARVNYNAWQRMAVALLDEIVSGDTRRVPYDVIDRASHDLGDIPHVRVSATLQRMIEQGSVRMGTDQRGSYLTTINPSMTQLRAMAAVWKGEFPK